MKRRIVLILLAWVACMPIRAQIGGHVEVEVDELSFTRQDGYDVIRWSDGTDKTPEVGAPELPVIFKTYVVPLEAQVTGVEVSSSNRMAVEGNFKLTYNLTR